MKVSRSISLNLHIFLSLSMISLAFSKFHFLTIFVAIYEIAFEEHLTAINNKGVMMRGRYQPNSHIMMECYDG